MRWFRKCIFIFVLSLKLAKVSSEEGFDNFLTIAMQGYPAWAAFNGLEPSPVIPDGISITRSSEHVNTIGEIWNQQIFNYPNLVVQSVSSNVLEGRFTLYCLMRNISVVGEYEVSGNVFTTTPVTGSGTVNMTVNYLDSTINFDNFGVTEDGFVDLSLATYNYDGGPYMPINTAYFEGLSAGGFESNVAEFIRTTYLSADHGKWFPVAKHIQIYLGELFEKTPLSEIIGTTLPPPEPTTTGPEPTTPEATTLEPSSQSPSTPTPSTPTTTTPPTTCPPSQTAGPRFSRTIYQTSLLAWPTQGHSIDLGIRASSPDGSPLQYELVTAFHFVELTGSQHINFTADIPEGAHVGPNNVMVMEVLTEEVDDPARFDSAAVVIVFPRGSLADEN